MANVKDFRLPGQMMPRPPRVVIDAVGNVIAKGQLVQFQSEVAIFYQVADVTLSLAPTPDGREYMQLILQAQFPVMVPAGTQAQRLLVVKQPSAATAAANNGNGEEAAGTATPTAPTPDGESES